jgi:putative ABC transport system permease protein
MLYHYLLTAYRSFRRNRLYALINILGLTIGITCSLTIFLYVFDELSYDSKHDKNIYRLNAGYHLPNNGGFEEYAVAGLPVGEVLLKDFPEIEQMVRLRRLVDVVVEKPNSDERIYETFFAADSNVFKVFNLPLVSGNIDNAIDDLYTVAVTERAAMKYFNTTDVVGRSLRLPVDSVDLRITAVLENYPSNTQTKFDLIVSLETYRAMNSSPMDSWWSFAFQIYLKLVPNADPAGLAEKIKFISRKYIADQEDGSGYRQQYSLIPFSDIHLKSNLRSELEPNSKAAYVYIFLIIGVFILVIACINFMNLSTARSALRAREVGMRKVAGAHRIQLIAQFLGEAALLTFIAVALSVIGVYLLLPVVNDFAGKSLTMHSNLFFWESLVGITLFVSLLAGSYPSFFLSAFNPATTLRGTFKGSARGNGLRRTLVVFQFAISIFLIAGTLIITKHLSYIRNVDLGFTPERLLVIPTRQGHNALTDFTVLKNQLLNDANITAATLSSRVPGKEMNNNVVRIGWDDNATWSDMRYLAVDHDFIQTYDLELIAGRSFDEKFPSDENEAFLINESGLRRLGVTDPQAAIGLKLKWQDRRGVLIGVLKDFHFMSANVAIEPFLFVMHKPWSVSYLSLRVNSDHLPETISRIKSLFETVMPDRIFEYSFLDEEFDRQYKSEDRFMSIFSAFAITAIAIACLGLYGLTLFMAELRIREIGIRKVLGASERSLTLLMTRDFLRLVLVSFVIAIPFAYWAMTRWLGSFPYREKLDVTLFVWAGLLAIVIALLTVGYQAISSARANPVKAINNL